MSAALNYHQQPQIRHVLNHDIMHCTAEGVTGNHLFSGRALGISEPSDIIQLHPDLEYLWRDITAHYRRIGLHHCRQVIWNLELSQLARHTGYKPSVFYYGPHEYRNWGDHAWLETVEYINSKNNFMQLARQLGIDVPATHCFDSVMEITTEWLDRFVYPCYLKAAISVSGVGIYRCETPQQLQQSLTCFEAGVPVQIQEEVIADSFLNMQYQVVGKQLRRLAVSEQILDGFAHQGNRFPASFEPWESIEPMAEWLKQNGIKGIFAFDVAVSQTPNGLRFPAIECNPRFNGASYPTLIANKMGISQWCSINLSTSFNKLSQIDLQDIEYDEQTGEGVILVNWGTILVGKLMLLIAGPTDYQQELIARLKARLNPST
ncbi:MAG: ATP-grasp domain-containing protein [Candidatus Thiodiazotropha taylori]|nr:ATP-grasp domain-containing protein [Candidatus Thiodiazotropha taylori]